MNIAIFTNLDLASNFALNLLIDKIASHQTQIFVSSHVGSNDNLSSDFLSSDLRNLQFFEQSLINELIFPLKDSLPNSKQVATQLKSFKQLANQTSRPLVHFNHVNSQQGIDELNRFAPDLIVSIRFGKILQQPVIDIPRLGVINLHSGLLPDYQGVMATFWAMLNGEEEIGTTLHFIDSPKIDSGPIIARNTQKLNYQQSYLENTLSLYSAGVESISLAIEQLAIGGALAQKSQTGTSQYFTFPSQQALEQFAEKGLKLFDAQAILSFMQQYLPADLKSE